MLNLGAKLRKISVFQHKKDILPLFFSKKRIFFVVFVCFMNTFPYICDIITANTYFIYTLKLKKL
jgi:hypothetical protein